MTAPISGTVNGHPIKLIGVCDILEYPYVIQFRSMADRLAIAQCSNTGRLRDGGQVFNFVDHSEFVEDI